jgi:hypothetical protein
LLKSQVKGRVEILEPPRLGKGETGAYAIRQPIVRTTVVMQAI